MFLKVDADSRLCLWRFKDRGNRCALPIAKGQIVSLRCERERAEREGDRSILKSVNSLVLIG